MERTAMGLHNRMFKIIEKLDGATTKEEREIAIEDGRLVTQASTQIINNFRFILEAEKFEAANGSLEKSVIGIIKG